MATTADVKRVNDDEANLDTASRLIKKQPGFAPDTSRVVYRKNDDTRIFFGAGESQWSQQTGYLEPDVTFDEVQLQGTGNFSFRKSASAWGADWNALEMGAGVHSISLSQEYDSTEGALLYGDGYHNGTNWTKPGSARTAGIQRTDDDNNPGFEISETDNNSGNFTFSKMYELKKDFFRVADGSNRIFEIDETGMTIGGTGYRSGSSEKFELNLVKDSYVNFKSYENSNNKYYGKTDNAIRVRVNDGTTTFDGYILMFEEVPPP